MTTGTSGCRSRAKGDQGQAAVELALVLPLVALLALVLVQVALVARDQLLVIHAAREAAREAAVNADPRTTERAAAASGALDPTRLEVKVSSRGGPGSRVRVDIVYASPTDVPIVGALVGDVVLSGAATMRVER